MAKEAFTLAISATSTATSSTASAGSRAAEAARGRPWRRQSGLPTLRCERLVAALLLLVLVSAPVAADVDPGDALTLFAVGDVADCRRDPPERAPARRTADLVPDGALVLGLGDMVYEYADAATLASCYEPTWGRHRANTLAVPGNHDYLGGSARDFRDYFKSNGETPAEFVAFSRWLTPGWLLIALDSNADGEARHLQFEWLRQTLKRELLDAPPGGKPSRCLLVMWHAPVHSSGWHRGSGNHMRAFWELLDDFGADAVLSGHEHFYEAFDPIGGQDGRPRADGEGIRQFVVGTGGAELFGFWRPPYASRARVKRHGVLELQLQPGRYAWIFRDIDGRPRDEGSANCRRWP